MRNYEAEYESSCGDSCFYEFHAKDDKEAQEIAWKCEVGRGDLVNLYETDGYEEVLREVTING